MCVCVCTRVCVCVCVCVHVCVCTCVCVCVYPVEIRFHVWLRWPALVPTDNTFDYKNVRIESYRKKCLSGCLSVDGADQWVDMACTDR